MPVFFKPVFDFFPFFCPFPSQTVEEPVFCFLPCPAPEDVQAKLFSLAESSLLSLRSPKKRTMRLTAETRTHDTG